jgi:hypothetical protein
MQSKTDILHPSVMARVERLQAQSI